jgi:NAD(P)-dependent dehydrogenase (short-subunit alcohol dehydrogenase family)
MKMAKIIVIGASGTIGREVVDLFKKKHEVICVGNHQGDYLVDLTLKGTIEDLFETTGSVDAVVCAAGHSRFAKVSEASDDDFAFSIEHKLMGQINLVRVALRAVNPNGSITLTTGLLAQTPWPGTVPTAMVNAALEGFVRAAALDVENGIRINAVSPILVTETALEMGMAETGTMSAAQTAKAYQACVEGGMTGQVLDVRDYGEIDGDERP